MSQYLVMKRGDTTVDIILNAFATRQSEAVLVEKVGDVTYEARAFGGQKDLETLAVVLNRGFDALLSDRAVPDKDWVNIANLDADGFDKDEEE